MCGILGLILGDVDAIGPSAALELHESIFKLQHRGQDACGIVTCGKKGRVYQCKGNGLGSLVFREEEKLNQLPGYMGIAHLRYPTAGTSSSAESQPFYVNSPYGICLAHNGNLINAPELREFLDQEAHRHVNTDSDSELMLNVFANALNETGKARANTQDIFKALSRVYEQCQGAWAVTAMVAGFGILGFRDSLGIRPLIMGSRPSLTKPNTFDYMLASESIALRENGFSNFRDIAPGQAVFVPKAGGEPEFHQVDHRRSYTPDIFEYVYFARPDTTMDGISVYKSRENMGVKLADKMVKILGQAGIDEINVIIPVPETSNTSATTLANRLNKPLTNGFVKNRFVGRSFILPEQKKRQKAVRRKLSTIDDEFKGRVVCLVDDSVVRGTTSREIVNMARESGATKVIIASCSPPITHPHIYGIDVASQQELVAYNRTMKEIAEHIGADEIVYQDLDDLKAACLEASVKTPCEVQGFEVGVFCGTYQTEVPERYFEHLDELRRQTQKAPLASSMVGSSGPVNGTSDLASDLQREVAAPNDVSLHNLANN
ncbi:nucleophile aminohydrolase [Xylariaceae sp. FL0804]|nr:nucleophile aminohydrolase [Xylariaceae sp. FL0804]